MICMQFKTFSPQNFIILLIKNSPLNNFKALHKRNQKIDLVARKSWLTKKHVEKKRKNQKSIMTRDFHRTQTLRE